MRLAILIALVACSLSISTAWADQSFTEIAIGAHSGYIVSEGYANANKADLVSSIPGPLKITGFWTPPEQDVAVADRVFRDLLHAAEKNPVLLFPDLAPNPDPKAPPNPDAASQLEQERSELELVSGNYGAYSRQYVGIIVEKQKLIFCNYSSGSKVDPSTEYVFVHKVFEAEGSVRFLQCQFDPLAKTCSSVSMIGSWHPPAK